jgi:hypothetical protein
VKNNRFVVMWDCNGLEAVEQLPDPAETTFALLKGTEPPKPQFNIMHWRLRAQFNTQRHYEIYVFETVKGITKDDIVEMFETSPQHAADTIRRIGTVFHSDRQTQKSAIV